VLTRRVREPDATWRYGEAAEHVADHYEGLGGRPPIVLVHGGFWRPDYDRAHLRPLAVALADRGHPVLSLEYRRVPGDPDATLTDLLAAHDALPWPDPIVVGHSAGGHLALLLAGHRGRRCVALAPVADLLRAEALDLDGGAVRDFLGGAAETRADLDPTRLGPVAVPATLLHGEQDGLVPPDLSRSCAEATGSRLVILPGAGHFAVIDPASTAWAVLVTELDRLAGESPSLA
jgi:pimeloyl-ACP methyl ester carboxylesterase